MAADVGGSVIVDSVELGTRGSEVAARTQQRQSVLRFRIAENGGCIPGGSTCMETQRRGRQPARTPHLLGNGSKGKVPAARRRSTGWRSEGAAGMCGMVFGVSPFLAGPSWRRCVSGKRADGPRTGSARSHCGGFQECVCSRYRGWKCEGSIAPKAIEISLCGY